jgi:hypothetical protein
MKLNLRSMVMVANMTYLNVSFIVDNLNVNAAHDLEIFRHFLKDNNARVTKDRIYADVEDNTTTIRYLQNHYIVSEEPFERSFISQEKRICKRKPNHIKKQIGRFCFILTNQTRIRHDLLSQT